RTNFSYAGRVRTDPGKMRNSDAGIWNVSISREQRPSSQAWIQDRFAIRSGADVWLCRPWSGRLRRPGNWPAAAECNACTQDARAEQVLRGPPSRISYEVPPRTRGSAGPFQPACGRTALDQRFRNRPLVDRGRGPACGWRSLRVVRLSNRGRRTAPFSHSTLSGPVRFLLDHEERPERNDTPDP